MSRQAHIELAGRMRKCDVGLVRALGDRVVYVMVKRSAQSRGY